MRNLEKIKEEAIRDICSASVTGAPKSKVRKIINILVDLAYREGETYGKAEIAIKFTELLDKKLEQLNK